MNSKVLVALGGNAILKHKEKGTAKGQLKNVKSTCRHLVSLIKDGFKILITHGNGPQVGDILIKNERSKDLLPPMPLDICGAQSQGMIGYMFQQSMLNELRQAGINYAVISVVTQTIVDSDDYAFKNPTKPIGQFYNVTEAKVFQEKTGWKMIEDSGRGYRRVVASPAPIEIVERKIIKMLFENDIIVIAVGGGGIPVISWKNQVLKGVEAVIDKDLSSQILASYVGVDILLMLTDIEKVYLNYGKVNQKSLNYLDIREAQRYLREGHFAQGSMAPKILAAIKFLELGGQKVIITSLEKARDALKGEAGTTIHKCDK